LLLGFWGYQDAGWGWGWGLGMINAAEIAFGFASVQQL